MVESDFDFESVALAAYQEYIELDLFNNGVATFSENDYLEAGLTAEDRAFIAFMATQEQDHATLVTNMLGESNRVSLWSALTADHRPGCTTPVCLRLPLQDCP
jgi:hypothetical protein